MSCIFIRQVLWRPKSPKHGYHTKNLILDLQPLIYHLAQTCLCLQKMTYDRVYARGPV